MARQTAAKDPVLKGAKRPLRSGGQGADTAGPGVKGAPTPVVAYGCGTWQPAEVQEDRSFCKSTVRKTQLLTGRRMTQEAKAGRPKGQGKAAAWHLSQRRITRRIRVLVARPERAPTWVR